MKTIISHILSLIAVIILFASCEDKIQIDLEEKGKSLTVDAFLNNKLEAQKIRLTYSDSYFSGQTPPALIGATVVLKDLTLDATYSFLDNKNGNYTFELPITGSIIHTNHLYELNVSYGGYEYKASTTCKRTANIDSLFFKYISGNDGFGNNVGEGNRVFLIAKDPTGPIPDFYWVKAYKNGVFYGRPENIQLEHFGFNNELDGQYFWEDKWATSGPNGSTDPCVSGDIAKLEIYGISRETHDFLKLGIQMSNNSGQFATTPVNLPTNIIAVDKNYPKCLGMFSVSDVSTRQITCP